MKILILNGPNLQLLGTREPETYGHMTLEQLQKLCEEEGAKLNFTIDFRQSNHEGDLVDWIGEARESVSGIIINPAAYTHTSIAIRDAILAVGLPCIEVHLSKIRERESFRHHSYIEDICIMQINGHGPEGYVMALKHMKGHFEAG